jgi:2-polyprenyl-3-methyl-5-hydroxy-6-metoxy-1,4-benzoquinol methylase
MIKDPGQILNKLILNHINNNNFYILDIGCGDGELKINNWY